MKNTNSCAPLDLQTEVTAKLASVIKKSNGTLSILIKDSPIVTISIGNNRVLFDIHDASILSNLEKEGPNRSFFDSLKNLRKFGEILNSNGLTLIVSRNGKEAFTLGRDATPTISSIITGSDDMHIDSITQVTKLGLDVRKS